jgi:hypothetical protein
VPAGKYRGIDGSHSPVADEVVDLTTYACGAGGTSVRHVPENNHEREATLRNAVGSFRREVVLALFTPFRARTEVLATTRPPGGDLDVPDSALARADLVRRFGDVPRRLGEGLGTGTRYGVGHGF